MKIKLNKTIETKLEIQAFEILKEKIQNERYRLMLDGIQFVLILEMGNEKNLKQEINQCIQHIDSIVDEIRLDTDIKKIIRSSACVLGNMIEAQLRVQIYI